MAHVNLPTDVTERVLRTHGRHGADWIRELPALLDHLMEEWSLVSLGEPFGGARAGLVVPTRDRNGTEFVLKLVPDPEWAHGEAAALTYWAGRGAVKLKGAEREHGAILLERLSPGTNLVSLCSRDDREATAAAASVMAELRTVQGLPTRTLPNLTSWIEVLSRDGAPVAHPDLRSAAERASSIASDLLRDATVSVLHGDLQHFNVLKAERTPWLAIDPKGVVGPPEAEAAALLRNPRRFVLSHADPVRLLADRVAVLAECLGDDPRLLILWGYVLAVVAAVWALEDQEGDADLRRWLTCADLVWHLAMD